MHRPVRQFLSSAGLLLASLLVAGAAAPVPDYPLTARELRQGYRDNRLIAKPLPGLEIQAASTDETGPVRLHRRYARLGGMRVLATDGTEPIPDLVARLRASGRYEFVEPDYLRYAALTPNDPRFTDGSQWGLRNDGRSAGIVGADIGAEAGWNLQTDAANVIVAVIDTGVRLTHEDLAANLWTNPGEIAGNGRDDDNNGYIDDVHGIDSTRARSGDPSDVSGHGTRVASIIGAVGNNGRGIAGVAWRVQLMALRFLGVEGTGATSDAIECIDYAIARGAHIINASYGAENNQGFSNAEREAIRRARAAGIIFVAAAGNSGLDLGTSVSTPVSLLVDNIVGVGNSGRRDEAELSSNFGSGMVELFAPGASILSADFSGDAAYSSASGTSFAAPHVSGALALLKARLPNEPYRGLINRLLHSARGKSASPNVLRFKAQTGGRLDLPALLSESNFRPLNDNFADAVVLDGANVRARGGNTFATAEPGEPAFAGFTGGASLWWRWTAPISGLVVAAATESVGLGGGNLSVRLGIYTGAGLGQLTPVTAVGPAANGLLNFNAVAGTTYSILVDSAGGAAGLYAFTLGTAPANNAFAQAEPLTGRSASITSSNLNADREAGEPDILGSAGGRSVWFRWTAPASGRFQLTAFSDEFDPLLAVYTGDRVDQLTLVAANDDARADDDITSSLVTLDAVAGTTYRIAVDADAAGTGNFTLSLVDSRWQFATGDGITSSPAVAADGTVYVGSLDHNFYALTAEGAEKWRYATGGLIDAASPTLAPDGTVYIGSNDRYFTALNPNGSLKWRFQAAGTVVNTAALAANGDLYFKDSTGVLYALSSAGNLLWQRTVGGETYASPVLGADGTIYVGAGDLGFHAFAPDGTLKWRAPADGDIYTTAAIDAAGHLYFGTLSGSLYSVTSAGVQRWRRALGTGFSSSPALGPDGVVYLAGYERKFHAINTADGTTRWSADLANEVRASGPIVASDNSVLIGCYDGLLYHFEANGTLRRTYATARRIRSSPALDGTRLFLGSGDGRLYAIDLGLAASADSPWPMFMHNARHLGRAVAPAPVQPAVTALSTVPATAPGGTVTLQVTATGGNLGYQWRRNGVALAGATAASLALANFQPADAGLYTVTVTNSAGTATSGALVVAPQLTGVRSAGTVDQVGSEIVHPNGNIYDQFLLTGPAATITAAPGRIARVSFVDLNGDIVQVEMSGAGSLTLVLESPAGPAAPAKYNQPGIAYLTGHARLYFAGADAGSHFNVFSVGTLTAVNQALFPAGTSYDGVADLASLAVSSTDGRFGALRAGNAGFFASAGRTGLVAPGVEFGGPVIIHDLSAFDDATPALETGALPDGTLFVNGGSLLQDNGRAVQIGALTRIVMRAGTDSHNRTQPAQANRARIERAGVDVTAATIVDPSPANP